MDWKQHLKDYHEFMQLDLDEDYSMDIYAMSQAQAKAFLRQDIENAIEDHGEDLYEIELNYMHMLGMEI